MKIIKYKKIRNKYRVYLDNETNIDLYENVILKNDLLLKKEIIDMDKIEKDNKEEELLDISIKYIGTKLRTIDELEKYLKKKNYSDDNIKKIIDILKNRGLLNDELYIKSYINDRFNLSSDGPTKIKNDLLNMNLNEEIIIKYLSDIENNEIYEKLDRLITKKINLNNNYSGDVLKNKIYSYFISLGYDKDMILDILNNKNLTNIDKGIKEYEKLLSKYKNKYKDYALENIIRQKLYLKGYSLDEIKKSID